MDYGLGVHLIPNLDLWKSTSKKGILKNTLTGYLKPITTPKFCIDFMYAH